eukprot:4239685-Amphidinium_carterae.2
MSQTCKTQHVLCPSGDRATIMHCYDVIEARAWDDDRALPSRLAYFKPEVDAAFDVGVPTCCLRVIIPTQTNPHQ